MRDLVQALRCIGESNVTAKDEAQISKLLKDNTDMEIIAKDLLLAPVWMRNIIKRNIKDTAL